MKKLGGLYLKFWFSIAKKQNKPKNVLRKISFM